MTDTYKVDGLTRDNDHDDLIYLPTMTRLIEFVASGQVPPRLQQSFATTYFLALYKDPEDLTHLRPLGIGTALRRLVAAHLCMIYQHRFAKHLLPYNWAIGVKGGTDFVINATQAQVDHFVNPQDDTAYDTTNDEALLDPQRPPTRALISLDIKNMFNSVSRKRCHEILVECFPGLVPFFDLLYSTANKCNYKRADGTAASREQEEGFAKGCPLSGAFAALVLHDILSKLDLELRARAKKRRKKGHPANDDKHGGVTHIMANVDDTSAVVPFEDMEIFL